MLQRLGMQVPQSPDDISAAWVDALLRAGGGLRDDTRVARVEAQPIGAERGMLSQTIRVRVQYDRPARDLPASVIVKINPAAGSSLDAVRDLNAFTREIGFYRDIAPSLSTTRLPRIWFAGALQDGDLLVMEDLAHCSPLDQVRGIRHEHVLAAVRGIGAVHARYWNHAALTSFDWLPDHDHFCNDGYVEHWPDFARIYELRIGRDAVALGERVARHKAALEARIVESAATLIHGDLRGDNLLFDQTSGEIVFVDWQLSSRSLGAIDPGRLLGGSEPPAERRGHQFEICAAWHQALVAGGVRDYSPDAALDDFRLAALYCLFIPVKMLAMVGPEPTGRVGRLVDCQAERFFAAALELDAARMLP